MIFAFLGLHQAAATIEQIYGEAEDKLAEFLCRIQIGSEKHFGTLCKQMIPDELTNDTK